MSSERERWIYAVGGKPAFHQVGDNIYEGGRRVYYVSERWWFPSSGGQGAFHVDGNWIFSMDGKPTYYYEAADVD